MLQGCAQGDGIHPGKGINVCVLSQGMECVGCHSWRRLHGIGDGRGTGLVQEGHTGTHVDQGERQTWTKEGGHEGNDGTEQDRDVE
eukprot:8138869-Alexandrium_andersonii.AAC.1